MNTTTLPHWITKRTKREIPPKTKTATILYIEEGILILTLAGLALLWKVSEISPIKDAQIIIILTGILTLLFLVTLLTLTRHTSQSLVKIEHIEDTYLLNLLTIIEHTNQGKRIHTAILNKNLKPTTRLKVEELAMEILKENPKSIKEFSHTAAHKLTAIEQLIHKN